MNSFLGIFTESPAASLGQNINNVFLVRLCLSIWLKSMAPDFAWTKSFATWPRTAYILIDKFGCLYGCSNECTVRSKPEQYWSTRYVLVEQIRNVTKWPSQMTLSPFNDKHASTNLKRLTKNTARAPATSPWVPWERDPVGIWEFIRRRWMLPPLWKTRTEKPEISTAKIPKETNHEIIQNEFCPTYRQGVN